MTSRYGVEEFWHNDLANSLRTNHLDITLQPFFARPPPHKGAAAEARLSGRSGGLGAAALGVGSLVGKASAWVPSLGLERLMQAIRSNRPVQPRRHPPPLSLDPLPAASEKVQDSVGEGGGGEWALDLGLGGGGGSVGVAAVVSPIGNLECADMSEELSVSSCTVAAVESSLDPTSSSSSSCEQAYESGGRAGRGGGRKRAASGAGVKAVVGGSLLKADGSSEPSMVGML